MADMDVQEITVASLDSELSAQYEAILAASKANPPQMDEVNRLIMERAPLLAKRAKLLLTENKHRIEAETDALRDAIADVLASSELASITGVPITKISFFSKDENGEMELNINPKSLKRKGARQPKEKDGLSVTDKVFRHVDGQREESTVGDVVKTHASNELKGTNAYDNGSYSVLFPKVNEDLGDQSFSLVSRKGFVSLV